MIDKIGRRSQTTTQNVESNPAALEKSSDKKTERLAKEKIKGQAASKGKKLKGRIAKREPFLTCKKRWCYRPDDEKVFAVSRSAIQQFINCPRCSYMHKRDGIKSPDSIPFTLNLAVDQLLKNEFDAYREKGLAHPIMKQLKKDYGIQAIPYKHHDEKEWGEWRFNFKGMRTFHQKSGLEVFGSIDDLWIDTKTGELFVVDYKATSKNGSVSIDEEWQESYKNQMDIYQWILRQKGYKVSDKAFFVYVNGKKNEKAFNDTLKFDSKLICYEGSDDWIEGTLVSFRKTLDKEQAPKASPGCKLCEYVALRKDYEQMFKKSA